MKYSRDDFDFSVLGKNNIDRIQLELIPGNKRVLEIGCATGEMSGYLIREKECTVLGVEADVVQAQASASKGMEVFCGFVDQPKMQEKLDRYVVEHQPFEVVFMSQVIEHVADPEGLLIKIRDWLTDDGFLVISTCNVAHWTCRFRLLTGNWEYEDYGIMDRDHLRFFTINSFASLLDDCGYRVQDFGFSFQDFCPFKALFDFRLLAPSDILRLLPFVGNRLRRLYTHAARNLIATQFVYRATPVQTTLSDVMKDETRGSSDSGT